MALAGHGGESQGAEPAAADNALRAVRVAGKGPITDPGGKIWSKAKAVKVALQPQVVAPPTNPTPAVQELGVRAVHNGSWVAFLLEWKDSTKSDTTVVDRFNDQVAVELPVTYQADALPSAMMGNPGGRVNVLQWRAVAQREVDSGREIVIRDLYPNAPDADLYYTTRLSAEAAVPYLGAKGLGNPVSIRTDSPVLDQMAEGFGSLTIRAKQGATGKGVYKDGMWHVTITAPLTPDGENAPKLEPGKATAAAFAVWDGGSKEVGSRKAWSDWVGVTLAE
ncbi:MAG: hypothetical protein HQL88_10605 [Magnetococcales bacterium]|nr:hypothetical protein [Magnetococcales bacterium]